MSDKKDTPNMAKTTMDAVFRFAIGDAVARRVDVLKWRADAEANVGIPASRGEAQAPSGAVITERKLVECHGGIQCFYTLSRTDGQLVSATGDELVPYSEAAEATKAVANGIREAMPALRFGSQLAALQEVARKLKDAGEQP